MTRAGLGQHRLRANHPALVDHLSWRQTYAVLAVLLAVITLPGHWLGLKLPWPPAETAAQREHAPDAIARSAGFRGLAAAMSLAALAVYAAVVNLVPLLHERGLSTSDAALALGLGGVGQVLGRLGYGRLTAATTVRSRTAIVLLPAAATIVLLGLLPGPFLVLVVASVLAGATRGVVTLLQATAVTDRWAPLITDGSTACCPHSAPSPPPSRPGPGRTTRRLPGRVLPPRRTRGPRRRSGHGRPPADGSGRHREHRRGGRGALDLGPGSRV